MDRNILKVFLKVQFKKQFRGKSSRHRFRYATMILLLLFIGYSLGKITVILERMAVSGMAVTLVAIFSYLLFYFLTEISYLIDRKKDIEFLFSMPVKIELWFKAKTILVLAQGAVISALVALGYAVGLGREFISAFLAAMSTGLIAFGIILMGVSIAVARNMAMEKAVEIGQIMLSITVGLWFLFYDEIKKLLISISDNSFARYLPFHLFGKAYSEGRLDLQVLYFLITVALTAAIAAYFYRVISVSGSSERWDTAQRKGRAMSGESPATVKLSRSPRMAVWKLALSHLMRDAAFRASFIPTLTVYLFVALKYAYQPSDKFEGALLGIVLFVAFLTLMTFRYSSSYKGAWILQTAPIEKGKIIAYTVEFAILFLLGAYLLLLTVIVLIAAPHAFGDTVEIMLFSWLSSLAMGYAYGLVDRKLPFTLDFAASRSERRLAILAGFPMIAVITLIWFLITYYKIMLMPIIGFILLLDIVLKRSLEKVKA